MIELRKGRRSEVGLCTTLAAVLAIGGCGTEGSSEPPPIRPPSKQIIAVVDFSASLSSETMRQARRYLEETLEKLEFGDRIVLLEMYRAGPRDSVREFVRDMPLRTIDAEESPYDLRQLDGARRAVLAALPIFFDAAVVGSAQTTDILSTLQIAAEYFRDAGGRESRLLLLTDMLHSTPDFEFDQGRRMPSASWVQEQLSSDLLPDLERVCVHVIGADPSTPAGREVRNFWEEYFVEAGASFSPDNYRLRAPLEPLPCDP